MKAAATVEAAHRTVRKSASTSEAPTTPTAAVPTAAVPTPAVPAPTTVTPPPASAAPTPTAPSPGPAPTVPRASADEHASCEPVRPVITVPRARIGCVAIVSVLANRRFANVARSNSYAYADLRLRIRHRQRQQCYQSQIFKVTHLNPPCPRSALTTKPAGSAGSPDLVLSEPPTYLNSAVAK